MKKLIAGNWKMNSSKATAVELVRELSGNIPDSVDVCVCPPFVYLDCLKSVGDIGGALKLGAQDCSYHAGSGAFTSEISGDMLKDIGCDYVILGHSERRQYHGETSEIVSQKVERAHESGLIAIICVGETAAEREAGLENSVVILQLMESIPSSANGDNIVIAYEPVWAIGTGKTATEDDVREMHGVIRRFVQEKLDNPERLRILYGGSVKADNAKSLLSVENVDGALVGGASLKADQFLKIIESVK